jgi:citrate lyase subunit beta/citryl-CoA lyase
VNLRSLLFVPADSERKLEKSLGSEADALILDLEDAVPEAQRPAARRMAANHLQRTRGTRHWQGYVRINPLNTPDAIQDLVAVVGDGLDGIVLPKADGVEDVIRLGTYLDVLEAKTGLASQSIRIIVVATETPIGVLNLASFSRRPARMVGITWGAEDLAAAIGAIKNREDDGELSNVYLAARSGALLAASAAGVQAIDTLYPDFRDPHGLEQDCRRSRSRGFLGRIAIHPDQVKVINRCFRPSAEDIESARLIVDAFAAGEGSGVVGINGRMYDRPHLVQAMKTLAQAGLSTEREQKRVA